MLWSLWCAASAFAVPDVAYVQADVIRLRSHAEAHAPVVSRLRVNTPVQIVDHTDGWLEVRVQPPGWSRDRAVHGYLRDDYVADVPLTRADAIDRAEAADGAEATRWAQRAVAVAPTSPEAWALLARVADDPDEQERAHAWLEGRAPIAVAQCVDNRVELRGTWLDGRYHPVSDDPDVALALARDVAPSAWFHASFTHADARAVSGTPFLTPFLTEMVNEDTPDAFEPSPSRTEGGEDLVVLGPCVAGKGLYTTAPAAPVRAEPVSRDELTQLVGLLADRTDETVISGGVTAPVPELPLRQVRLEVPYELRTCGGEASHWPRSADTWALVDDTGRPLAGMGSHGDVRFMTRIEGPAEWFAVTQGRRTRWLGLFGFEGGTQQQVTIVAVDDAQHVDWATQVVRGWGC